ncbi:MAG: hypothetical protein Kow00120_20530 [Anaerolineae bacterium]
MDVLGLPEWFNNLTVGGLALAPLTVAIVQIVKVIGARVGLPEGYSGYIALAVSVVMVALALAAGIFQIETEVATALQIAQRFAEAALTLLAALGWYAAGKRAALIGPVAWRA